MYSTKFERVIASHILKWFMNQKIALRVLLCFCLIFAFSRPLFARASNFCKGEQFFIRHLASTAKHQCRNELLRAQLSRFLEAKSHHRHHHHHHLHFVTAFFHVLSSIRSILDYHHRVHLKYHLQYRYPQQYYHLNL